MHRSFACQLPALQKTAFHHDLFVWVCVHMRACVYVVYIHNLYIHTFKNDTYVLSEHISLSSATQFEPGSPEEQLEHCSANLFTELKSALIVLLSLWRKDSGFLSLMFLMIKMVLEAKKLS